MATKAKGRNVGFDPDEAPVKGGRESRPRPEELVEVLTLPKNKKGADAYKAFRPHGAVFVTGQHWVRTKKRDGSIANFPAPCANFDPKTGSRDHDGDCPWCKAEQKFRPKNKEEKPYVRFGVDYWLQGIDRMEQERAPTKRPKLTAEERESGMKDPGSDSWTPNRALRLSGQDLKRLRTLKELNVVKKNGETTSFSIFDPKYGCDINIKYDGEEKVPSNRWTFARVERTPLTEEEQGYLLQDLSQLIGDDIDVKHETAEMEGWARRMGLLDAEEDEDEDEDEPKPKRKTSGQVTKEMAKKARKAVEDLDEDEDDEDDEEEDDPPPKKSKKSVAPSKKSSKKVVDEDEDEDDDEEDDPPPKKSAKKPSKKVVDEDEDEDDEDDEEDDPPPKKSKKPAAPAKKSSKKVVDEDDEDDDEDDEEEDDDPPPKKTLKKPAASTKKPSKKVVDEDDEDEDEEDEDEEDDPPPKKKVKVPPPPKGRKSKPADEDDDDEDDDVPF